MSVRIQERDGRVGEHLYRARTLATYQIAELEFGGKIDAARRRLYDLNGEVVQSLGFSVDAGTSGGLPKKKGAGMVWRLTKEYFAAYASGEDDHPGKKYPWPLRGRGDVAHLIATNDLYVRLVPGLNEGLTRVSTRRIGDGCASPSATAATRPASAPSSSRPTPR